MLASLKEGLNRAQPGRCKIGESQREYDANLQKMLVKQLAAAFVHDEKFFADVHYGRHQIMYTAEEPILSNTVIQLQNDLMPTDNEYKKYGIANWCPRDRRGSMIYYIYFSGYRSYGKANDANKQQGRQQQQPEQ